MPLPVLSGVPLLDALEIEGRRVLIRVDLDVPESALAEKIRELRVEAALPSIRYACEAGAQVIVAAHTGSSRENKDTSSSLEPAGMLLAERLETELYLPEDVIGDSARKVIFDLRDGQICLLENLALHPGEEQNDDGFALALARLFDVYVNDAPGALDKRLASTVLLPRYSRIWGMGLTLNQELKSLERLATPASPVLSIVCARELTPATLDVLDILIPKSNALCVGGALGPFFTAAQGRGDSNFASDLLARCRTLVATCRTRNVEMSLLPNDVHAADSAELCSRLSERVRRAGTVISYGSLPLSDASPGNARWLVETLATATGFTAVIGDEAVLATLDAAPDLAPGLGYLGKSGFPALKLLRGDALPGLEALAALGPAHST